ncbi:Sua5/YciO/YrdC/YwlC family protein [Streptomyces xanthochromogenes]|uniref:Sua5/YciO/YrdC/YwlC family protein n=1 Tax=Streptomyces xanthochromogenes TaxID=67384 RepID=UPI00382E0E3D
MPATTPLDIGTAANALATGQAVILPNPSPLTYVVAATTPEAVNNAKARPADQEVALWVHSDTTWTELTPELDLTPAALGTALNLLRVEMITLLVPVRIDTVPPVWATPALRDGHLLLFGAHWPPMARLLARFPRLYVSSANRTGRPPAPTATHATAMFGPDIPVVDADRLRDTGTLHAATTMLRIASDGTLTHIRHGAQDHAHGSNPQHYLRHLDRARGVEPDVTSSAGR